MLQVFGIHRGQGKPVGVIFHPRWSVMALSPIPCCSSFCLLVWLESENAATPMPEPPMSGSQRRAVTVAVLLGHCVRRRRFTVAAPPVRPLPQAREITVYGGDRYGTGGHKVIGMAVGVAAELRPACRCKPRHRKTTP